RPGRCRGSSLISLYPAGLAASRSAVASPCGVTGGYYAHRIRGCKRENALRIIISRDICLRHSGDRVQLPAGEAASAGVGSPTVLPESEDGLPRGVLPALPWLVSRDREANDTPAFQTQV